MPPPPMPRFGEIDPQEAERLRRDAAQYSEMFREAEEREKRAEEEAERDAARREGMTVEQWREHCAAQAEDALREAEYNPPRATRGRKRAAADVTVIPSSGRTATPAFDASTTTRSRAARDTMQSAAGNPTSAAADAPGPAPKRPRTAAPAKAAKGKGKGKGKGRTPTTRSAAGDSAMGMFCGFLLSLSWESCVTHPACVGFMLRAGSGGEGSASGGSARAGTPRSKDAVGMALLVGV